MTFANEVNVKQQPKNLERRYYHQMLSSQAVVVKMMKEMHLVVDVSLQDTETKDQTVDQAIRVEIQVDNS